MMTTLGATISKTLAKALFNWWTTSLPCSAAADDTVGVGGNSGVAPKADIVPKAPIMMGIKVKRIGSRLDSIQHATFNGAVHSLLSPKRRLNCKANGLTDDILLVGSLRICVQ